MAEAIVLKTCYVCKSSKPLDEFHRLRSSKDGRQPLCKLCATSREMVRYYKRTARHPILSFKGTKRCPKCGINKPRKTGFARAPGSPDRLASWCKGCQVGFGRRVKYEVLLHYSAPISTTTPTCRCCNEARLEFLVLDHINGGGTKERRDLGKHGWTFLNYLKKRGYPAGYQTLCHNCNMAKYHYNHCPHTCTHESH